MTKKNDATGNVLKKSYQPTVGRIYQPTVGSESYQPVPKGAPKTFIPPKGRTGACVVELKTVGIKTKKK